MTIYKNKINLNVVVSCEGSLAADRVDLWAWGDHLKLEPACSHRSRFSPFVVLLGQVQHVTGLDLRQGWVASTQIDSKREDSFSKVCSLGLSLLYCLNICLVITLLILKFRHKLLLCLYLLVTHSPDLNNSKPDNLKQFLNLKKNHFYQ
jgi:hypothetical protein